MSLPIPRDPGLTCSVCEIVFDVLDSVAKTMCHEPAPEPAVTEAHVLASVAHWWVGNGLEKYRDDPRALFAMLADAFIEYGVDPQTLSAIQMEQIKTRTSTVQ